MRDRKKTFHHIPVLGHETMQYLLRTDGPGNYFDCTLGGGGHSRMILEAHPENRIFACDVDDQALQAAHSNLAEFGDRFQSIRNNFGELANSARALEIPPGSLDGILMDIGVSSHQLDMPQRGFAYGQDGPLDMRMDRRLTRTASHLLNEESEKELRRIFKVYGEERQAGRIARAVVTDRETKKWERTSEFAEMVTRIVGRSKKGQAPAPARTFQALRIAVNQELDVLENGLKAAFELLKPGGHLVVITFHSLEDRIVKHFFKELAEGDQGDPRMPIPVNVRDPEGKLLTRKPVIASEEERKENPRANCSKLRAIEKF